MEKDWTDDLFLLAHGCTMSDVFARNCFTDLNVLVQSSKKINKEIILSLIDCKSVSLGHGYSLTCLYYVQMAMNVLRLIMKLNLLKKFR